MKEKWFYWYRRNYIPNLGVDLIRNYFKIWVTFEVVKEQVRNGVDYCEILQNGEM